MNMPNTDIGAKILSVEAHTDKLNRLAGKLKMMTDAASDLSRQRDLLVQVHDVIANKRAGMNISYSFGDHGRNQFIVTMDTTEGNIDRDIMRQVTALTIELVNIRLKKRLDEVGELSREITSATGD